ncbi:MAG: GNAT family N-acetyltransferase [Oscillospiraceae bacterium]|jgi:ribosomal-protein-alanine N-acetyltransferase|nr:GNAT family N-acetyltransferase [Oscillospiraceae bacterium]
MTHKGTVTLETERLILRRFALRDAADAYQNWFSDPEVAMYMRWDAHGSVVQTEAFMEHFVATYEKPNFYRWAIALKTDNRAIGAIGFHVEDDNDAVADAAYSLGKAFWNRGIASEALQAVLRFAFVAVGVNRMEAFHAVNNPASGKVMQKAGMQFEGRSRQKFKSHKGFEDCDTYAILAEDYLSKTQQAQPTFRPAQKQDLDTVAALSARWAAEGITWGVVPTNQKDFAKKELWLCCLGGEIIGYAAGCVQDKAHLAVFPGKASCFELEELYLAPEQRGCGIGGAFFRYLEAQLRQQGVTRLTLSTATKDSERILRFYRTQGMGIWTTVLFKELS